MSIENEEIKIFREYLRIPTAPPDIDYEPCVEFIQKQATLLELPNRIVYPVNKMNPVVIVTWLGEYPELPSICLNSHMDVVSVFPAQWTYPPFEAHIDDNGRIYARGSQDMKCVGMQYFAAIRALKRNGIMNLKRTIHIIFIPDEETGSHFGMESFIKMEEFSDLNIGFALDEGIASENDVFHVFYGERSIWHIHFKCFGNGGHGSLLHKNTAGEKVQFLINKFMDLRSTEILKLKLNSELTIGDVTTINLTILNGGIQTNIVPTTFTVSFDVRLSIDVDHNEFQKMINKWCQEAGGNIDIFYEEKDIKIQPTSIGENNQYWMNFINTFKNDLELRIKPQIFPGGTDSRFLRSIGIPVIGFSPINNTPVLLHDNDEYLTIETYLKGIQIYTKIVENLGNT